MQDVTKNRGKYIGGSDIPVIMGLSPFKTRWQLLQEKAGIKENDFTGNEYTEYGNVMEEKIRNHINVWYGYNFQEDKRINGILRYHADGYDPNGFILEVKTTSHIYDSVDDYKMYLVQMALGVEIFDAEKGVLAVYERPEDFDEYFDPDMLHIYEIDREYIDNLYQTEVYPAIEHFCEDWDRLKENPALTEEDLQPGEIQQLARSIIALEQRLKAYKQLEELREKEMADLKAAMERNNIKSWQTPEGVKITLVADGKDKVVKEFDTDTFAIENPGIYARYQIEEIKKGRAGYVKVTLPKENEQDEQSVRYIAESKEKSLGA